MSQSPANLHISLTPTKVSKARWTPYQRQSPPGGPLPYFFRPLQGSASRPMYDDQQSNWEAASRLSIGVHIPVVLSNRIFRPCASDRPSPSPHPQRRIKPIVTMIRRFSRHFVLFSPPHDTHKKTKTCSGTFHIMVAKISFTPCFSKAFSLNFSNTTYLQHEISRTSLLYSRLPPDPAQSHSVLVDRGPSLPLLTVFGAECVRSS